MMSGDKRRGWICFTIAALVLGWSVFAFGTPEDIVKPGEVIITQDDIIFLPNEVFPVRSIASWATGIGAVVCLFLLPGRHRVQRVPLGLGIAAGILLLFGWFMVVNASHEHDQETWEFVAREGQMLPWAPGSIVHSRSLTMMIELSLVALALWAAVRSSEGSAWRGLLGLLAILGAAVALVGLFHKSAGAPTIYWMNDESQPTNSFFAPYVYNANAGAFMNLCLPLAIGLALARVGDERRRARGIVWAIVAALLIAGVVVAASKGAIIVLLITVPTFLLWNGRWLRSLLDTFMAQRGRKLERLFLLGAFALLVLSLVAMGITYVLHRWNDFIGRFDDPSETDITGRLGIVKLMYKMSGPEEASWHGFGPGTFRHLVPYFNLGNGDELSGYWKHGHCDPLQTTVEWGWLGAAAWVTIGIGAVVSGILLLRQKSLLTPQEVPLVRGMIFALVMVGVHSCQDFPFAIYSIHLSAILLCGICWGLLAARQREARRAARSS